MDCAVRDLSERVFRELFLARERGCTVREIVSEVYAHCPHGGALNADGCVRKAVYYLKKKLALHGATITADWGPCSRYRLEMVKNCYWNIEDTLNTQVWRV